MTVLNSLRLFFRNWANRCSSSRLVANTGWAFAGYGLRLLIQAAFFIVTARYLGVEQFGGLVAATALINVASPFVGVGSGMILIKNVARDKELFPEYWGNGLLVTIVSGLILCVGLTPLCSALLQGTIPTLAIVYISISDLIFVKLLDMAGWSFQGFEMLSKHARLNVLISLTRAIGIGALVVVVSRPSILQWSAVYLAGSIFAASTGVIWATRSFGKPRLALDRIRSKEMVEGLYFSISQSAQTVYNDIDKTMLARLATLEAAGLYGAAYRLIDVALRPVTALLCATYAGFFREGKNGINASLLYARRLLARILPYTLFAFAALLIGAPGVPRVLGHEYTHAVEALRWLAVLPLLKTLHYFIADALTGAGYQGLRSAIQVGAAIFNILLNLWIIPTHGWRGAAWSSIASDGLLALILWIAANRLATKTQTGGEQLTQLTTKPIHSSQIACAPLECGSTANEG